MATNFRNVLKVYGLLRSFSPDDNALLETLRGLTDPEREALVETLGPVKRATKKAGKSKQVGRSPRVQSLTGAIGGTASRASSTDAGTDTDDSNGITGSLHCGHRVEDGDLCGEFASSPIHDPLMQYVGYHEFQPAQAQAASGGD